MNKMRKLSGFFWIFIMVCGLLVFCSSLYAKTVKLTYSNFFPPTHVQSKLAQSWCDEVKKRTDGKVVVEYYPGQTLTKGTQTRAGMG